MATRRAIRDAVHTEMVNQVAKTYTVDTGSSTYTIDLLSEDISLQHPENQETLPQVVYTENYRKNVYNGVGESPDIVRYDQNGDVTEVAWREYIEAQFLVDVRASNDFEKEPIYEELRSAFQKYEYDPWPESDLHADIIDVSVEDSTSNDAGDAEDVIRGDQVELRVEFFREFTFSTDNINAIDTLVDADNDGTTDSTLTTN